MASLLTALIIEPDTESRKAIEDHLVSTNVVSVQGTTHDLQAGYRMTGQLKPSLVIVSLNSDSSRAVALIETISNSYPETAIFAVSSDKASDLILRAMRAGAIEFLVKPINGEELKVAVGKVQRARMIRTAGAATAGKVITVLSAKGGYGSTTIATNLATCLVGATDRPVVLMDMDLEMGDVATFLNVTPEHTIMDLAQNISRVDENFLKMSLAKHSSGAYVLAEPPNIEAVEYITADLIRKMLPVLQSMAGYVVIDARKSFDDRLGVLIDHSDMVVLVSVLSVPALKNIRRALEILHKMRYPKEKIRLVVNRYLPQGEITARDAEKTLGEKIKWIIPNDFNQVMSSINRGIPVSMAAPESEIGKSFLKMASDISGRRVAAPPQGKKGSFLDRLFKS